MEHIRNILAKRQTSLFAAGDRGGSGGSGEWSTFNTIRGDQTEMFPVATPRNRETPHYPNIVPIHRYRTA